MVQAAFEALLAEGVPARRRHRLKEHPAKGPKSMDRTEQHGGRSTGKPSRERLHRASVHRAGCPQSCHSPGLAQHPALETPAGLSPMVKGTHKALRDLQRSRLVLQGLSRSGWAKTWVQLLAIPCLVPACSLNHLAESNNFASSRNKTFSMSSTISREISCLHQPSAPKTVMLQGCNTMENSFTLCLPSRGSPWLCNSPSLKLHWLSFAHNSC